MDPEISGGEGYNMADWMSWWLATIPGWGAVRLRQLVMCMGNAEKICAELSECKDVVEFQARVENQWSLTEEAMLGGRLIIQKKDIQQLWEHQKLQSKSKEEYEYWTKQGVRFITIEDKEYPQRLRQIYDPPYALYFRGNLPDESRKTAAVIGARACSGYGASQGRKIARELAAHNVQIISGLAYGIDSEGHCGALESGVNGATYAILGCGVDQCYPVEHEQLASRILAQGGGILSEFPPGTAPCAAHFPMRNRIISGLSDCILVMEARRRSGSLITVDQALEQGREVFALPGRISDKLSEGCIHLISHGANLLTGSDDVIRYLFKNNEYHGCELHSEESTGEDYTASSEDDGRQNPVSMTEKRAIYSCLDSVGKTVEDLMHMTGLSLDDVRLQLLELLLEGQITETIKGYYSIL